MNKTREILPLYKCHKVVWAVQIRDVDYSSGGDSANITPVGDVESFTVSNAYVNKHQPKIGGYFVKYEDGYESYSPKEVFENGYTVIKKEDSSIKADDKLDTKILMLKKASGSDVSIELLYGEVLNISEGSYDDAGVMANGGIKTISLNIEQAKKLCDSLNYAIEY